MKKLLILLVITSNLFLASCQTSAPQLAPIEDSPELVKIDSSEMSENSATDIPEVSNDENIEEIQVEEVISQVESTPVVEETPQFRILNQEGEVASEEEAQKTKEAILQMDTSVCDNLEGRDFERCVEAIERAQANLQ